MSGSINNQPPKTAQHSRFYKDIVETIHEPLLVLDPDLRVLFANRKFYSTFKVTAKKTIGALVYDLGNQQWDIPLLRTLLEEIIPKENKFIGYQIEHDFPVIGKRIMLLNARRIINTIGKQHLILLAIEDITTRILMEHALQESEERFRRAFETAKDGILLNSKTTGKVISSNPAAQRLLGYSQDELQKQKLWKFGFLKNAGQYHEVIAQLKEMGFVNFNDIRVKTKKGKEIPADVYFVDKTKLVQCNIRDISDRQSYVEMLFENEIRYHELFNHIGSGVAVYEAVDNGRDFIFLDYNHTAGKLDRTPREKVIGRKVTEVFPGIREMGLLETFRRVWKTGKPEQQPATIYKDEHLMAWRENYVYKLPSGEIVAVYEDLTNSKRVEEELRISEERFKSIASLTPDHIIMQDRQLKYLFVVNPQLGLKGSDMLGKTDYDFLPRDEADRLTKVKKQVIKSGKSVHFETSLVSKAGETEYFDGTFVPRTDDKDKIIGLIGYFRNITKRKKAVEDKRKSDEKYQQLIESSNEGIWITDADFRITYVNQRMCDLLGYSPKEIIGLVTSDFFLKEDLQEFDLKKKNRTKGIAETYERRLIKKNGEILWTLVSANPQMDESGNFIGNFGQFTDITEQKNLVRKLIENEERYHELFNNIGSGVAVYEAVDNGRDFIFKDYNPIAEKLDKTPRAKLIGHKVTEIFPGIREMGLLDTFRKVWKTGKAEQHPATIYEDDHLMAWRENYVYKLPSGEIVSVFEDITENKQMEINLRESEENFRGLYENATIGMYRTTPAGEILLANPALLKMLGYRSFEQLAGRNLNKYGFEPDYPRQKFQNQVEEKGEVKGLESTWKRKDGSSIHVRESARVIKDKNEKILYYEGTVEDVSERYNAEKALHESEEFLNNVVENIPDMIFVKDASDLRFVRTNKAAEELIGFSNQELLGKNDYDFFPREQAEQFVKKDKETLKKKELVDFPEEKIQSKANGERILHTKKIPILDERGNPKYLLGISEDITDYKKAVDATIDSEKRYRSLFEDSPIAILEEDYSAVKQRLDALKSQGVTDMHAYLEAHPQEVVNCAASVIILDVNRAGLDIFKAKSKDDLIGSLTKILSAWFSKNFQEELVKIANGETKFGWEGMSKTLSGEQIYTSLIWSVVPGHENDLSRTLLTITNITERKQAENALHESEERYRSLFEDSPVSLWEEDFSAVKQRLDALRAKGVTDMNAYLESHPKEVSDCSALIRVINVNKAGIKLFKAKKKEDLFKNLSELLSPQSFKDFRQELENIAEGKTYFYWEGVNQTLAGEPIDISFYWSAVPGYESDLSKVIVSIEDISKRKQSEKEMRRLIEELRHLSDAEKKNRVFAEFLAQNAVTINRSIQSDEILDAMIENLDKVIPLDSFNVMEIQNNYAHSIRARGYEERGLDNWINQKKFELANNKVLSEVIQSKKYKITSNTEKSENWTTFAETAWIKSNIIAPLMDDQKVVGFVNVDSTIPDFYTEEHAQKLEAFTNQFSTALKNARLFENTQQRLHRMQAMTQIDQAINSSLDLNVSLEIVLIQAKDQLNADAVDILMVDNTTNSLVFSKSKGFRTDEVRKSNFRLGTGLPGKTVLERTLTAIPNLRSAPESYFKNMLIEREGFSSYYCVPLITKGELKGVMEIYFRETYLADQDWKEFLEMLAQQTAIAINNAELLNSLQASNIELVNAYETTLRGWVDALDMRDHETEGHTQRVTELSLKLARLIGIKESEVVNFERGALLHDIGKVAISDAILKKPGPLTDEEWKIMRNHPSYAYQLLSKSKYLIPALNIPYCHHEKWDGTGYPRGLKGEAIPLAARIFSIVDVWDALISDRPYRKAWTKKMALKYIREQSGLYFDPEVVKVFLQNLDGL
jgi:PAS domain S-box-containing protein